MALLWWSGGHCVEKKGADGSGVLNTFRKNDSAPAHGKVPAKTFGHGLREDLSVLAEFFEN